MDHTETDHLAGSASRPVALFHPEAPISTGPGWPWDPAAGQVRAVAPGHPEQPTADGPFMIVTAGGEPVPNSPAYDDWGQAVTARDRANSRAARRGRQPKYQVAPAAGVAGPSGHAAGHGADAGPGLGRRR